jgi:hypothetical protein
MNRLSEDGSVVYRTAPDRLGLNEPSLCRLSEPSSIYNSDTGLIRLTPEWVGGMLVSENGLGESTSRWVGNLWGWQWEALRT